MSFVGKNTAPYRLPCDGTPRAPKFVKGSCYQHKRASEKAIAVYANETKIADGSRAPQDGDKNETPQDCTEGQTSILGNCYAGTSSGIIDQSLCHKQGVKGALVCKAWHGRWPFSENGSYCSGCETRGTKYLEQEIHSGVSCNMRLFWVTYDGDGNRVEHTDTKSESNGYDGKSTVDRATGANTVTGCSAHNSVTQSEHWGESGYPSVTEAMGYATQGYTQNTVYLGLGMAKMDYICGTYRFPFGDGTGWGSGPNSYGIPSSATPAELEAVFGNWFYRFSYEDWTAIEGDGETNHITLTKTDTHLEVDIHQHWIQTSYDGGGLKMYEFEYEFSLTVTIDLSTPYTFAEMVQDAVGLSNLIDLSDDKKYPWTADIRRVPFVAYHNGCGPVTPTFSIPDEIHQTDWLTTYTCNVTPPAVPLEGELLPAGYGPHFAWGIPRYTSDCLTQEPLDAGEWTPADLPKTATWWTDWATACNFPWPAFIITSANGCYLKKCAVTKEILPSVNYFRPCGADRYALDYTKQGNVTVAGSNTVTAGTDLGIAVGDLVLTLECGLPSGEGIYPVAGVSGSGPFTYTLGSKVDDYTFDWSHGYNEDGPAIIKVRWPHAWPICGRVAIDSMALDEAGTTLNVVLKEAAEYLRTGDKVSFTQDDETAVLSGQSVTVTDSTHFSIAATSVPAGATYVVSYRDDVTPHTQSYRWHDTQPKGDFFFETQKVRTCPGTESPVSECIPGCVTRNICEPSVMAVLPPGAPEDFGNCPATAVLSIPLDLGLDYQWIAWVHGSAQDPFWQKPKLPNNGDLCSNFEPGSEPDECKASSVEARCEAPAGAPAPPPDVSYTYLEEWV